MKPPPEQEISSAFGITVRFLGPFLLSPGELLVSELKDGEHRIFQPLPGGHRIETQISICIEGAPAWLRWLSISLQLGS